MEVLGNSNRILHLPHFGPSINLFVGIRLTVAHDLHLKSTEFSDILTPPLQITT